MPNRVVITIVITATAMAAFLAGCGPGASNSRACFNGSYRLTSVQPRAHPGDLITVSASGPTASNQAELQSWGQVESSAGTPLWNVEAISHGESTAGADVRVGSNVALAGSGLPNVPFRVQVPDVGPGNYLIQFMYTFGPPGQRGKNYYLCAPIHVT